MSGTSVDAAEGRGGGPSRGLLLGAMALAAFVIATLGAAFVRDGEGPESGVVRHQSCIAYRDGFVDVEAWEEAWRDPERTQELYDAMLDGVADQHIRDLLETEAERMVAETRRLAEWYDRQGRDQLPGETGDAEFPDDLYGPQSGVNEAKAELIQACAEEMEWPGGEVPLP